MRGAAAYGDRHDSALVLGGVVGYNLPPVRPHGPICCPGDAVAFATDGIEADYSASLTPDCPRSGSQSGSSSGTRSGNDDALAAVVRYLAR